MNNHFDHGTETCLLFCPSNGRSISPRVSANEKSQSFSAALEPSLSASVVRGNDVVRFHKRHGEDLLRPVHASRKLRFLVQLEVLCYFRLSTSRCCTLLFALEEVHTAQQEGAWVEHVLQETTRTSHALVGSSVHHQEDGVVNVSA